MQHECCECAERLRGEAQFPSWDVRRTWGRGEVCESCSHDLCTRIRKQDTIIAKLRDGSEYWGMNQELTEQITTLREALEAREHDWGPYANKCGWCYELYPDHRDDCMRQKALAATKAPQ